MSISEYLAAEVLSEVIPYRSEVPLDAVAFAGSLHKHPYDRSKCMLMSAGNKAEAAIYEFRLADIRGIEQLAAAVNEEGSSLPMVKLWVQRGSFGIRYEPFEVDSPLRDPKDSSALRDKFSGSPALSRKP